MCDPIIIATVISAGAQLQAARVQADIARQNQALAKAEADIQNAQLQEQKKVALINAKIEEDNRKKAYRRNIATMRALNKGKDSASFLSIIDAEENALSLDIENIRLGGRIDQSRLSTQISVNTARGTKPDMSKFYIASGVAGAAGTIGSGIYQYQTTRPGGTTTTNTPTTSFPNSGYTRRG